MRFATLGPAGSNHEKATRTYLRFHGLTDAELSYFETYSQALDMLRGGDVDFFTQVCAHPEVAITIEKFHRDVFVVDSFIAPTRPMGVVTRRDVGEPKSLGYMIATAGYFDRSRWSTIVTEISNGAVAEGLLAGKYDSGFTTTELVERHPDRFRIDEYIGEVDVCWLVYGRERVRKGEITAWRDAPVRRLLDAGRPA
ncbi:MAG: hypothetical protein J0H53_06075 [Rhizobiales bacterium]|nr:hypothetical protein [Hyphomicrobiales bacterium]OJU34492.1 MAG: hypothetical protein BGN94_00495 [Rhizobiales bacterium 68-8]